MTSTRRNRTFYQRNMHDHDYIQLNVIMQHCVESLFKTLTCKMCLLEIKIQICCNACLGGEWWSHHWQKYLLHLGKKERKHFALIFIPNSSQPECTDLTLKGQLLPIIDLKIILQIIETKNQYHKWHTHWVVRSVTTAAYKNDNTLKMWAYSNMSFR